MESQNRFRQRAFVFAIMCVAVTSNLLATDSDLTSIPTFGVEKVKALIEKFHKTSGTLELGIPVIIAKADGVAPIPLDELEALQEVFCAGTSAKCQITNEIDKFALTIDLANLRSDLLKRGAEKQKEMREKLEKFKVVYTSFDTDLSKLQKKYEDASHSKSLVFQSTTKADLESFLATAYDRIRQIAEAAEQAGIINKSIPDVYYVEQTAEYAEQTPSSIEAESRLQLSSHQIKAQLKKHYEPYDTEMESLYLKLVQFGQYYRSRYRLPDSSNLYQHPGAFKIKDIDKMIQVALDAVDQTDPMFLALVNEDAEFNLLEDDLIWDDNVHSTKYRLDKVLQAALSSANHYLALESVKGEDNSLILSSLFDVEYEFEPAVRLTLTDNERGANETRSMDTRSGSSNVANVSPQNFYDFRDHHFMP